MTTGASVRISTARVSTLMHDRMKTTQKNGRVRMGLPPYFVLHQAQGSSIAYYGFVVVFSCTEVTGLAVASVAVAARPRPIPTPAPRPTSNATTAATMGTQTGVPLLPVAVALEGVGCWAAGVFEA